MANKTTGELPAATTPLDGTEITHFVQGGNSRKATVDDVRGPKLKSLADLATAAGDIIYGLGSGLLTRLAKGTAGQLLRMNAGATAPEWTGGQVVAYAAAASGTAIDVTGIPAWARRINVILNGLSTNGGSELVLRLGTASGVETSGYLAASSFIALNSSGTANYANGFGFFNSVTAPDTRHGRLVIEYAGSNTWVLSGSFGLSNTTLQVLLNGSKTLAAVLDRIRLTTQNGTDAFDAGTVTVTYE